MNDKNNLSNLKNIKSREIEDKILKASLEMEKELALKELDLISKQFQMEEIIKDGVRYTKKIKDIQVYLGRVSVNWSRPIFEGSKKGKTIYYYPADEILSPPKKGRASYKTLSITALLGAFIPYYLVSYIMSFIRGVSMSPSTAQRYTETVGQFAEENLDEIITGRKGMIHLKKDEILIASIDGSSSMINKNKKKGKNKRKSKCRIKKK